MAEKQQQVYPIGPTNAHAAKSDVESAAVQSEELCCKKRIKYIAYFAAFPVFQTIVILIFALTVMRIKSPKFRFGSVAIESLSYSSSTTAPSFNMRFNAQVTVKNTNFGHLFEDSTIRLAYKGIPVGMASIPNSRARARYTKKMNVAIDVASDNVLSNSNFSHWSEFWVFDTDQPGQIEWEGAADEDSEEQLLDFIKALLVFKKWTLFSFCCSRD